MSRLTNRAAVEMLTKYHTANKAHIKMIEACDKTIYVLTQLNCINTFIIMIIKLFSNLHLTI